MASRYVNARVVFNDSEYYSPLRDKRNVDGIVQYSTIPLANPTPLDRARILSTTHIWKYGDRLYNLADKFYGDHRYWWVIAWWNSYPTEASIANGVTLVIPINIEEALNVLGV